MASSKTITVTCPKCGKKSEFKAWESVNTETHPDQKMKVVTKELFRFICPECGNKSYVNYGFLYHDMKSRIMIAYAVDDENAEEMFDFFMSHDKGANKKLSSLLEEAMNNYLYRIVRSQNQLIEKILIFDAGLDDRVIEIIKLYCATQILSEENAKKIDEIIFTNDEDGYMINIILDDGQIITSGFNEDLYQNIKLRYGANWPDLRDDQIIIDLQWAMEQYEAANRA